MSALLQPYTEAEHVVLAAYFGVATRIATALDCAAALSRLYPKGTGVGAPSPGEPGPGPIDVAVARIALGQAQQELPQCGVAVGDAVLLTRRAWPGARSAIVRPQHLFGINWADSGPGMSWPESYCAMPLPLYGRWVVTASVDSPDMWGTTDWALGSFPQRARDVGASSRRIIQRYWNALAPRRYAETIREMWEGVESEGLVSGEEALRMRGRMFRAR